MKLIYIATLLILMPVTMVLMIVLSPLILLGAISSGLLGSATRLLMTVSDELNNKGN